MRYEFLPLGSFLNKENHRSMSALLRVSKTVILFIQH